MVKLGRRENQRELMGLISLNRLLLLVALSPHLLSSSCSSSHHLRSQSLRMAVSCQASRTRTSEACRGPVLRLRGGAGPKARLKPEETDIMLHYPNETYPEPDSHNLQHLLKERMKDVWNGRRIFIRNIWIHDSKTDEKHWANRYAWDSKIRIGTMEHGTGDRSVVRMAGDDEAQLWGRWHFRGRSVGIFEGLYVLYNDYGPYRITFEVESGAQVLFEQCEVRSFGGKCLVAKYFSEITMNACTVGGSGGSRSPDHHKKFQIWSAAEIKNSKRKHYSLQRQLLETQKKGRKPWNMWDHFAPKGGTMFASDGVSIESGAWLIARRCVFEDTGRIMGMAVRCIGHGRVNLILCRFTRNHIELGADATAVMDLDQCHKYWRERDKENQPGYRGETQNFYAHRAIRLPGNGTSTLEAQDPVARTDGRIGWREFSRTNSYWQDRSHMDTDPNRKEKRDRQRAERKQLKQRLRKIYPNGVPKDVVVHAKRRDYLPWVNPRTDRQRSINADPVRSRMQQDFIFSAPDTLSRQDYLEADMSEKEARLLSSAKSPYRLRQMDSRELKKTIGRHVGVIERNKRSAWDVVKKYSISRKPVQQKYRKSGNTPRFVAAKKEATQPDESVS